MTALTVQTNFDFSFLGDLLDTFPKVMFGVLSEAGYQARAMLKNDVLSGQVINLHKYPKDKAGKRTVNYKILRDFKGVIISSYALNLYNPRKVYKGFAPKISNKINSVVDKYGKNEFQKIVNKI